MKMIKRTLRTTCVCLLFVASAVLHGTEVNENMILAAARKWIANNAVFLAELPDAVPEKAVSGLQGWVDCFEKATLAGTLFCGGIDDPGEASGKKEAQDKAYEFGKSLE